MVTTVLQQPTPERFFNVINAYAQTEALKTAIELEIFTAIAEANTTASTMAKRCQCAERGARTVCDFLTIHGFLTKEGTQYSLAPDSALFLNRQSPAYIGGTIEFLPNAPLVRGSCALDGSRAQGRHSNWRRNTRTRKSRLGEVC